MIKLIQMDCKLYPKVQPCLFISKYIRARTYKREFVVYSSFVKTKPT